MTEFEKRAILALARVNKLYDDANPDVGMGPFPYMFVEEAAKTLGFELSHGEAIELGKQL